MPGALPSITTTTITITTVSDARYPITPTPPHIQSGAGTLCWAAIPPLGISCLIGILKVIL
ncbi:uncharacterized protein PgNI_07524 [Pyricularia grisea]|uniref:Uncharacterized protein n=1 Tax=Pyricularia grisea TaxID=148305 RepID=A0A6P8B0F8_PYRGI|nr:uncharacterized protein PgNI_07524 [Pyricularia grisea]TLD08203.1 hypothetical protein PgNI_07524 [Pyricularia grisea]